MTRYEHQKMRHRSLHSDQDDSLHPQHKQDALPPHSHPNDKPFHRPANDWLLLLSFSLCFFVLCLWISAHVRTMSHDSLHGIRTTPQGNLAPSERTSSTPTPCAYFGCPIHPVELSQLDHTTDIDISPFASEHHIVLTHRSNRKSPPINQDRAVLLSPFSPTATEPSAKINPKHDFLIGIFDGHDDEGATVAQFASDQIPSRIASAWHNLTLSPADSLTRVFVGVDRDLPPSHALAGGCTGSLLLRMGSALLSANVGDSLSYLAAYHPPPRGEAERSGNGTPLRGSIQILHENVKHKPHLPLERTRIESRGGRIHIPPGHPMGSRVIVHSSVHDEDVGLAMSRSIGDLEWTRVGVIPDPEVEIIDLNRIDAKDGKLFAVVASDGLLDHRGGEFVLKHLAHILFEMPEDARRRMQGGRDLVTEASPIKTDWYRDDISFVAIKIEL